MDTSTPTSSIRLAELADVPRLVEMGHRFLDASPWAKFGKRENRVRDLPEVVRRIVTYGVAFVAEQDGVVIGGLLGTIGPAWCIPSETVATELAWWIDEEHRGGRTAVKLLRTFEGWAYAQGASAVALTSIDATAGRLLEALDYRMVERSYWKELT